MKSIIRVTAPVLLLLLLALPTAASAAYSIYTDSRGNTSIAFGSGGLFACGASNICQVAQTILFIINSVLVPVLFAIAFIVFLWGVFKTYIYGHGDPEEVSKGHKLIFWGVIGFVVMISLWGLVNVVANTFGLAGYGAPYTPRSY